MQKIVINEIYPNPDSGNEWIELLLIGTVTENFNLNNYTISDNSRQIYKFTNEQFINQLLVIELNGLNNDGDSVILKDSNANTLDSFSYQSTEKGWSWSRQVDDTFVLTKPSQNQINETKTLSPSPVPTSSITTPNPSPTLKQNVELPFKAQISLTIQPSLTPKQYHYDVSKIKLANASTSATKRLTRLVLVSNDQGQIEIFNAIIGSSLIILSAVFLVYVKFKFRNN